MTETAWSGSGVRSMGQGPGSADPIGDLQLGGGLDPDARLIGTRRIATPLVQRRGGSWIPTVNAGRSEVRKQSVRKLLADLRQYSPERLHDLQLRLFNAGLFGDTKPIWGYLTAETTEAYKQLLTEASTRPDQTVVEVLDQLEESSLRSISPDMLDEDEEGTVVNLTDPESIKMSADDMAKKVLGRKLTDKQKEFLVQWTHSQERGAQTRSATATRAVSGGGEGVKGDDVDAFMDAISGIESGGNPNARNARTGAYGRFQIMPANWPKWAPMAGLASSAPQTPENQEKVARAVMTMYYKQFKNWRDVAIAWYAGPGAAAKPESRDRNRKQGKGNEPSINKYADSVMARMGTRRALGPTSSDQSMQTEEVVEFNGGGLEDAVRNLDPSGAGAMDFARTAREFESLLGGGA